jgi:L-2-hydroxyglutarate oxidase LhgO
LGGVDRYDIGVIGAGILGLATTREILRRHPDTRIVILEKEAGLARHQTGHNSGVIHSGLYYKPGSAKARMCVAGAALMFDYCDEREIAYDRCGKLVVAVEESELGELAELERRAKRNGVQARTVDDAQIRSLEPHVRAIRGLHVPGTAIVDFGEVARALGEEVTSAGATIRYSARVTRVALGPASVRLETTAGSVECGRVVSCAGLGSDEIAHHIGGDSSARIIGFRGDYYALRTDRARLVRGLVYPVPDPRFPFLGVHFTRRIDGAVWLGPNAVLAFAREGYRRRDVDVGYVASTFAYPGFRRLATRYWRTGLAELLRDYSKRRFLGALRRYMPELRLEDLVPGPSGVRAQVVGADGQMLDDFWFESRARMLVVRNAPSPAATASLGIAREIADRTLAVA